MLIGEVKDLLDRKLFGLRYRYIGWISRSMAAVNWTVYSTGHNLLTVFGNPKWLFVFSVTNSRATYNHWPAGRL
jgi:hypothetical protein